MLRKLLLTVVVSIFTALNLQAAQIPVSWDGGGNYNDWDNANNWQPNIVPNNSSYTYAVTIDAGTEEVWVCLRLRSTIDQLDSYGEVELIMGPHDWQNEPIKLTIVDPNGLTNHGHLVTVEFVIEGNVTNTAGATLELEDTEIEGDLYNQAGATIEVYEISDEVLVVGDVENAGSIILTPVCNMYVESILHNTGRIDIYGGGCVVYDDILDNNDTGVIQGFGVVFTEQLQNEGKIYAYGGSLSVVSEGSFLNSGVLANYPLSSLHIRPAEDVNNLGTIEVNAGGIAFDCNMVNEPNAVIKLHGGTLAAHTIAQSAGAIFEGFGGITGNVMIKSNGLIELTGPTNIVGDVTIEENAELEISDGQVIVTGHTACNGTIHLKGGRIVPQGGLSGDCNIISEPSDYNNMEDLAFLAETWLWQTN